MQTVVEIICDNCGETIILESLQYGDACPECNNVFSGQEEIRIVELD